MGENGTFEEEVLQEVDRVGHIKVAVVVGVRRVPALLDKRQLAADPEHGLGDRDGVRDGAFAVLIDVGATERFAVDLTLERELYGVPDYRCQGVAVRVDDDGNLWITEVTPERYHEFTQRFCEIYCTGN